MSTSSRFNLKDRKKTDVAEGLLEVHARGIVHRDVKPANILWDEETDEAVLTDFGISARLTAAGSVGGTPFYMPPEAFRSTLVKRFRRDEITKKEYLALQGYQRTVDNNRANKFAAYLQQETAIGPTVLLINDRNGACT